MERTINNPSFLFRPLEEGEALLKFCLWQFSRCVTVQLSLGYLFQSSQMPNMSGDIWT